jgi:hypothetical protein
MLRLGNRTQHLPILGAILWFATLLVLVIYYLANGRPQYESQTGRIPYISDIAASGIKPFFIIGCSVTAISLVGSLSLERWFRHRGRLAPNTRKREKVVSVLSILSSVIGGAGLILLAVFDTLNYIHIHRIFLLVFMVGLALSALFTVVEVRSLTIGRVTISNEPW